MPTATLPLYRIESADWHSHGRELRAVREAVFIHEFGGDAEREWDRGDARANHLLARAGDPPEAIGTLRWLPSGQIERLAVRPQWRRRGVGAALLACAVRELTRDRHLTPFVLASGESLGFFNHFGFTAEDAPIDHHGQTLQTMVLREPEALISADLGARVLGETQGRLFLTQTEHLAQAARQLAAQALRQVELLSADLQPAVYDQQDFVDALRHLAIERRGRLPVRILVIDPEPSIRRGHRLIELARVLSSDLQIRLVPKDWAEHCDQFLLCDRGGLFLTRYQDPRRTLVDFSSGAETLRLRRLFDEIWEQGEIHPGLRRLYL
ncbi:MULTISPECIES: GNAT family N-acetyltransferase [Thiorhodovibrio]|uniref:GNAT family N-acetyltransferase n=1 Tax=Thiorhodovibrio TaxID=61593 RepID=UPI0019145192|nr:MULTISPECIES: GNAT family N-acetyltransferase [Thiorhodovibrio]MBK5967704.1 hypothetical protein [Thiorhodovibrio winogradskyi]WPL11652.1 hypothetical protein Thiosp_01402 [Thiorhodovibrio litoralis]